MLLDISAVLPVRDMAKPPGPDNLGFVFPHPPWEQHAMFAQQIALHLAKFAAAAACKASSRAHGDESFGAADTVRRGHSGECASSQFDNAAGSTPPNAAIRDPSSDRSAGGNADCDGVESAWFEAKSAIRSRTRGWNWAQSIRLAGIEAVTDSDAKAVAPGGPVEQPAGPMPTGTPSAATEWALFEDRPGKAGWILNSTGTADRPGRNLTFTLADPW